MQAAYLSLGPNDERIKFLLVFWWPLKRRSGLPSRRSHSRFELSFELDSMLVPAPLTSTDVTCAGRGGKKIGGAHSRASAS